LLLVLLGRGTLRSLLLLPVLLRRGTLRSLHRRGLHRWTLRLHSRSLLLRLSGRALRLALRLLHRWWLHRWTLWLAGWSLRLWLDGRPLWLDRRLDSRALRLSGRPRLHRGPLLLHRRPYGRALPLLLLLLLLSASLLLRVRTLRLLCQLKRYRLFAHGSLRMCQRQHRGQRSSEENEPHHRCVSPIGGQQSVPSTRVAATLPDHRGFCVISALSRAR
jgi:hypothetical protein